MKGGEFVTELIKVPFLAQKSFVFGEPTVWCGKHGQYTITIDDDLIQLLHTNPTLIIFGDSVHYDEHTRDLVFSTDGRISGIVWISDLE